MAYCHQKLVLICDYNACVFGDGKPITLKFAHAVGEVLTAGLIKENPPLPFRYYI